jgi:hypothetical protein
MSKDSVTRVLNELSCNNPSPFLLSLNNVEIFCQKILLLTNNNLSLLGNLFAHSKKGMQYKTDQNFYFLWSMLRNISIEDIKRNPTEIFGNISKLFETIQKTPRTYSIDDFLYDSKSIKKIDKKRV